MTVDHGRIMAPMLTEVESFTLSDARICSDLHDSILKYLPKMNRLTILETNRGTNFPLHRQWLQNPYPNLQYFSWHDSSQDAVELIGSLRAFLQINPGIFFSLKTQSACTLQELAKYSIPVSELFVTAIYKCRNSINFPYLQQLCREHGIDQS